jgi:PKD repeat protein
LLTVTRDYSWDFGEPLSGNNNYSNLQHPVHQYAAAGTYTVTLTLESDCNPIVITQQIVVTQVPPAVPLVSLNLGNLEATTADNYQWYYEGVAISGAVFQQYFPTQTGNYTVQITDASGCTATSLPFNVTSVLLKELQSFNHYLLVQNENWLSLQCNPLTDCFQSIELIDLQGRVLKTYNYQQKISKLEINTQDLQSGVYLLRVNGRGVRKVFF